MKAVKGVGSAVAGMVPGGSLAMGGLSLLGGLLGSRSKPQLMQNPRGGANDAFSQLLQQAMSGQNVGGQLASGFQLPGYGGSFGQGITPDQISAIQQGMGSFNQFMGGDQGASALSALSGFAGGNQPYVPPEIAAALGNLPGMGSLGGIASGNNDIVQRILQLSGGGGVQAGQSNDIISRLLGFQGSQGPAGLATLGQNPSAGEQGLLGANTGVNVGSDLDILRQFINAQNPLIGAVAGSGQIDSPERQLLLQAAGQDPTRQARGYFGGAQDIIGQLLPSAAGMAQGGGFDPAAIFSALDQQRQGMLGRNERDIREQLGTSGLRFSTNLADTIQQGRTESDNAMMAEVARLMPQYAQTQQAGQSTGLNALLQAAGQMSNIGSSAGQLGLGRQSNVLSGLGTAGNLGMQGGQANIQALIAAMQGQQAQTGQQQGAAEAATGTNLNAQTAAIQALIQQMTGAGQLANQRTATQGTALSSLGSLNQGGIGQLLQALQSAGGMSTDLASLGVQAGNQQGNTLNQLLSTMTGAASQQGSQGIQAQDILARLFGSQQGNALTAATALPGAFSQISQLPGQLSQGAFNLAEGGRSIQDQIMQRMYQDFTRQQSMLPNVFSYLGGTPAPEYQPSGFSQTIGGATDVATLLAVLKKMGGGA